MDLNELLVFTHVIEAGSFTAAADRLGIRKSTVSRRVSALESRLGVRLLHRTTRQLRLTEAGVDFHRRCVAIMRAVEDAEQAATDTRATPSGLLRITAPVDFGARVLPPLVTKFARAHPEVHLHLDLTNRLVDLVAEGVDVALRAAGQLPDSSLIARKLGTTAQYIVASPAYLNGHATPTEPEHLREHDFVLHPRSQTGGGVHAGALSSTSSIVLLGADSERTVTVSTRVHANEFGMLRTLAVSGMGLTILPDVVCAADLRAGTLIRILPKWHLTSATLYAMYPSTKHLSLATRAFLDFIRAELVPPPWLAPQGSSELGK